MIGNIGYERRLQALERRMRDISSGVPLFTAFTPVLTQGVAITLTGASVGYELLTNNFYMVAFLCACNSAGTAANSIRLSGFSKSLLFTGAGLGSFHVSDSGTTNYTGTSYALSATEIVFLTNATGDLLGISPAYTIAANDSVSGFLINRVAQ